MARSPRIVVRTNLAELPKATRFLGGFGRSSIRRPPIQLGGAPGSCGRPSGVSALSRYDGRFDLLGQLVGIANSGRLAKREQGIP